LTPTKNSPIQTPLTPELKEMVIKSFPHLFTMRAHNPNWIPRATTRPHIEKEMTDALHKKLCYETKSTYADTSTSLFRPAPEK